MVNIMSTASGSFTVSSGSTIAFTFPAKGKNTALFVTVVGYDPTSTDRTPVTATWNGTSMNTIDYVDPGGSGSRAVGFWLASPVTGNNNLVITWNGTMDNWSYEIYALSDCIQSTPTNTAKSTTLGATSPLSLDITTLKSNSMIAGVQDMGTNAVFTSGQTLVNSYFTGYHNHAYIMRNPVGTYTWSETTDASGVGIIILFEIPEISPSFRININGGRNGRPRPFAPGIAR